MALSSAPASAQTTPEATPPAAPPPAPPPVAVPAPMPPPPPPLEAKPPTNTEAMPATKPDTLPPIDVGAWTRVGSVFQSGSDPKKMNDWHMDHAFVELHAGGKIHKNVGVTLNLAADMISWASPSMDMSFPGTGPAVMVEDAIISFDLDDAFHVWVGRLLVPVDRANASGPFFMIPWNYPGFITVGTNTVFALPKEGPLGRNNGAVVWGDIPGGKLTYLVGAFDNAAVGSSPLYSGRLRLALWDAESGFWGNGSFFGDKDMLSIGVGGQFQKHGSSTTTTDKDYAEVNADVLVEKKIPGGGWFTAEGAYYHYSVLTGGVSDSMYVLGAFATGIVGVGNLQPMVRYQWAKVKDNTGTNPSNIDVGLSYLIKGPALRLIGTYSHTKLPGTDVTANSVQFGAQAIFF